MSELGNEAEIYILPEDIEGSYDFIPDVRVLSITREDEKIQGRQSALQMLTTNQNVLQLLSNEGYVPKIKEILESVLEDAGLQDADRFFEKINANQGQNQLSQVPTGVLPSNGEASTPTGMEKLPSTLPNSQIPEQLAQA
ncbi:MAG: hypothetical protein KatS3mg101_0947 [Patescibacteria group bacterium]|nr:MAG: hypothetical protein KatS3mg101_0947 [Patescibacteria group bacterium]